MRLEEFEKIEEIKQSLNNIDTTYFTYRPEYKKHILNISVQLPVGKYNIDYVDNKTKYKLREAGLAIKNQIDDATRLNGDIQYLLIIEGQASKDNYVANYELSYQRALALMRYWEKSGINFGDRCEVLIAGSGTGGTMREVDETRNQRFLIQIMPKTGTIDSGKN